MGRRCGIRSDFAVLRRRVHEWILDPLGECLAAWHRWLARLHDLLAPLHDLLAQLRLILDHLRLILAHLCLTLENHLPKCDGIQRHGSSRRGRWDEGPDLRSRRLWYRRCLRRGGI